MSEAPVSIINPFVVESPEKLDIDEVFRLFVAENSGIDIIDKRKHTFIWGPRGSGKSMLLRFLEPRCQAIRNRTAKGTWEDGMRIFLSSALPFVGIRVPCKEGYFNKSEFRFLDNESALILTEHMMNLSMAGALFQVLEHQFPPALFSQKCKTSLARKVAESFDNASFADTLSLASQRCNGEAEPFKWVSFLIDIELRKLATFLRRQALPDANYRYTGTTSGYHDFLLPVARAVQELPMLSKVPIYFLIDDADKLRKPQQSIVNTWMANRDQNAICIKAAAQFEGYKTFETRDGWLLEPMHDYTEFHIEELYSGEHDTYTKKVSAIAARRLTSVGITVPPEIYFPPDPEQEAMLSAAKIAAAQEWREAGTPGRERDFVHRYSVARLFQELRKTRKRRNYAGFFNLVHLSSGVIRYFLEPCYLMVEALASKGEHEQAFKCIPPSIQQDIIFKFSEDFILIDLQKIKKNLSQERLTVLDKLNCLITSLAHLFYEKLTDPEARESRVFSFTVRGAASVDAEEVLDLGVRYRYFQLRTYSSKEGGGRQRWYILNRRLCPVFKLDPTGFEGRMSIQTEHLDLAMRDPDAFIKLRLRRTETERQEVFNLEGAE
jgi:hypothetical protein